MSSIEREGLRKTRSIFPIFTSKYTLSGLRIPRNESLDYQICENVLYKKELILLEKKSTRRNCGRWILFVEIAIITSFFASAVNVCIEDLIDVKFKIIENVMYSEGLTPDFLTAYIVWLIISFIPVLLSAVIITFVEPKAAGSGILEVKCYLNGIVMPKLLGLRCLLVKMTSCILCHVGGLPGGKEGPLIYAGAALGSNLSNGYIFQCCKKSLKFLTHFRNDNEKRDFVLGGVASGVSAAFSSPIGGILFSLEETASFWNLNIVYRAIVVSALGSFMTACINNFIYLKFNLTFLGIFNFGRIENLKFEYFELPIFALMGAFGGLAGAFFIFMNSYVCKFRVQYLRSRLSRILEVTCMCIFNTTLGALMIYYIKDCRANNLENTNHPVKMFCEENEYSAAAEFWFQTPEDVVRSLLHYDKNAHSILTLFLYSISYYLMAIFTTGMAVSLGIFIPSVLIGAAFGRLMGLSILYLIPSSSMYIVPGKYALIGAGAFMGGLLRMTVCATVILMESTGASPSFAIPLIITQFTAKYVGDKFGIGIYDSEIKKTRLPFLHWHPPKSVLIKNALYMMSSPVTCFEVMEKAGVVFDILHNCTHNGFPIVDNVKYSDKSAGRLCGIILRYQLVVIFLNGYYTETRDSWQDTVSLENFRALYPLYPGIETFSLLPEHRNFTIDFSMFMNFAVATCKETDSVENVFHSFRALGLRHLVVTDLDNRVSGIITRKDISRLEHIE